jgi:4'-phosphopantetheinyl transferase
MGPEILELRRWQDRQARILGRLLLRAGLIRLGLGEAAGLQGWFRACSGRPGLAHCRADISISHTSGLALCALAPAGRVGVDVERQAVRDLPGLRAAFGAREWREIQAGPDPALTALALWTAKEAALKADGRGFSLEPSAIDARGELVSVDGALWHISRPRLAPGWVCAVATDRAVARIDALAADVSTLIGQLAPLAPAGG